MTRSIDVPAPSLKVRPEFHKGSRKTRELRIYKRFELSLLGRYMRSLTREEYTCRSLDISVGGASLQTDFSPQVGERVVVLFEEFGGLEGRVTRAVADGFALEFTASHRRRQRLAAQITWLLNRHEFSEIDQRRSGHDRVEATGKRVTVEMPDNRVIDCNIIDISVSGALVQIGERPPLGTDIQVGKHAAKVVRHHAQGVGVEFVRLQQVQHLQDEFG